MTTREKYLTESKAVKDCAKWLNKRIKEKQKEAKSSWDMYHSAELNAVIREMVSIKAGLEKHSKKLKHMANEL